MTKITSILFMAGALTALSATTTTSSADSGGCRSSEPAALRAYLRDAKLHVPDGLSNYSADLSAFGTPRPMEHPSRKQRPAPVEAPVLDMTALRAYFHGPEFQAPDGLSNYSQDHRVYNLPSPDGQLVTLVRVRQ